MPESCHCQLIPAAGLHQLPAGPDEDEPDAAEVVAGVIAEVVVEVTASEVAGSEVALPEPVTGWVDPPTWPCAPSEPAADVEDVDVADLDAAEVEADADDADEPDPDNADRFRRLCPPELPPWAETLLDGPADAPRVDLQPEAWAANADETTTAPMAAATMIVFRPRIVGPRRRCLRDRRCGTSNTPRVGKRGGDR